MTMPGDDTRGAGDSDHWRARFAGDLQAYRAEQQWLWGGIDEMTLARYEAGVSPPEERARVEQALRDHPALRECLEFSRELSEEWQVADSDQVTERRPDGRPESVTPQPATVGSLSIHVDDAERSISIPRRPERKPIPRWLATAAAAAAIIGLGLVYRYGWRQATPDAPPEIVEQEKPAPKKPVITVDKPKDATDREIPAFADALATLEKRVSAGIGSDELRSAYDQLLKDYPDHKAEIESNPSLASALAPKPPAIVKKSDDTTPPPVPSARAALLARIAPFAGKPIAVNDAKVGELRQDVIRYLEQHPEPKIPEMDAFAAASEPTARNELLYVEARAKALMDAAKDDADVRELRSTVLTLRFRDDTRPLVLESKPLTAFMNAKQSSDPAAKAAEMKPQTLALVDRLSQPNKRGPYLLCVLPPGIRTEAVDLYKNVQSYARALDSQPDASLLDYITRARRPIPQDTLGMIIPMFIYPDRDNPGPWNQVLEMGNQGVRIKVVLSPNMDNIMEADPAYIAVIDSAHRSGIEVLGRVGCPGGLNGVAAAQATVMKWHQFYANRLDGLFFVEQSTDIALIKPYATLYRYARGLERRWQIVACPGSPCAEAFLTETGADILCPSTNPGGPFTKGWEGKYDPERFAAIVYDVTDETLVPGFLMTAVEKHFGWICVEGKDAYISKPPYLGMQLRWIQNMNNLILNRTAPVNAPGVPAKKKAARKM
jgi:Spherulation-specific family 4